MKRPSDFYEILMHVKPVDGRLGINGLATLANRFHSISSDSRALFVFTNKRRRVVKALYWSGTGFCLWMMRLEKMTFPWPRFGSQTQNLSTQQFEWLISGIDFTKIKPHSAVNFERFC